MNRILKTLKLNKEGRMTTKEITITILMGILIAISIITCKKETNSETQTTNSDNKTYKYVIAKSGLKLREATDTKSKVLTTIPFNTQVEVIGEQEGEEVTKGKSNLWFQISYDGIEGFAYGEFLSDFSNLVKIPDYLIGEYLETTPKDTSCRSDMSSTLYIREGIIICV
ncbi:MAG: SH3 domain-containing protein, partial [Leptospiraceae bacterium]|nr:SH3 domain-containing protein [Leptospiraceae bacterium]